MPRARLETGRLPERKPTRQPRQRSTRQRQSTPARTPDQVARGAGSVRSTPATQAGARQPAVRNPVSQPAPSQPAPPVPDFASQLRDTQQQNQALAAQIQQAQQQAEAAEAERQATLQAIERMQREAEMQALAASSPQAPMMEMAMGFNEEWAGPTLGGAALGGLSGAPANLARGAGDRIAQHVAQNAAARAAMKATVRPGGTPFVPPRTFPQVPSPPPASSGFGHGPPPPSPAQLFRQADTTGLRGVPRPGTTRGPSARAAGEAAEAEWRRWLLGGG